MKKLLHKWFPKFFTIIVAPEKESPLQIVIVNDESDLLIEALGIHIDRAKELTQIASGFAHNSSKTTTAFQHTISYCKHQNEVIFCSHVIIRIYLENQYPFLKILS